MFCNKLREGKKIHPIVFLPVFIALLLALSACHLGRVAILKNTDGSGFTMDFNRWGSASNCEIDLKAGDEILIEIECVEGEIAFNISGKKGSKPYTGNKLTSARFTVTVTESDKYVFDASGKNATGKITVKKSG